MPTDDDALDKLRKDMDSWLLDQELDVAAEVYDPRRPDIHELADEDLVDRFRTLLGFDVTIGPPDPPPDDE